MFLEVLSVLKSAIKISDSLNEDSLLLDFEGGSSG